MKPWPVVARWGACFTLALCFHIAGGAFLLAHWSVRSEGFADAPAILVELSPLPVAPQVKPTQLPPGPQQNQAKAQPAPQKTENTPVIEAPPAKNVELAVTPLPEPKPAEKTPQQRASLETAPSTAAHRAVHAAARAPGAAAHDSDALPSWKSALLARLERYKHYPAEAEARGEQGVTQLAFSVDRGGRVHHARILRSSGYDLLDRATLALLERAQPLPPPPAQIGGDEIAIVVPIRYSIR